MQDKRRYDVDALRSIALFLLIFYHLAISFTSVAKWILFVPNNKTTDGIWSLLSIFNIWRIPLLFLIAGIALRFSYENRGIGQLFKDRFKRLGLPYLFGVVTFVPLYIIISASFIYGDIGIEDSIEILISSFFSGGHLWFLINILIYCVFLIPIMGFLSNKKRGYRFVDSILRRRGGVLLFAIPIILEGHLLDLTAYNQEIGYGNDYAEYYGTDHGFLLGFLWLLIGIVLTSQGNTFWEYNIKNINTHAIIGIPLLLNRIVNEFEVLNKLIAFESFNFIILILGLGAKYLNKDSTQLQYYKDAIFPVYIVHMPVQMGVMSIFSDINLPLLVKFPLVLFLVCFLSLTIYHGIKNIKILRPLFGLKNKT
tara:strand:- start:446 stop:1546 length:1101 start_codon:yes stop_codon:yes gene_type:complete